MGSDTRLTREYGRSPIGERVEGTKSLSRGQRISTIGALTTKGLITGLLVEGTLNGEMFLAFIIQFLVPLIRPGDIVFMDNARIHYMDGVESAIRQAGGMVRYLPRYSPDLNPIE